MGHAYDAAAWQTYYATLGSASAALAGLLFVGLSLNLRAIITDPAARGRAREALGSFFSLLVLSLLVLIPQSRHLLGTELLIAGLARGAVSVRLQRETLRRLTARGRRRRALQLLAVNIGTAMVLGAGVSLLLGRYGGLFWLVPAALGYLSNAVVNAWVLTVQTGER